MIKKLFIGFACLLALLAVFTYAYFQHALFGSLPDAAKLDRIQSSPNYAEGAFKNLLETPFLTNGATQLSIRIENWLADKKITRPEHLIPTEKTDLFTLNPKDDLAIWLGHSSWYLQLGGKRMLIDPVFSDYAAPVPGMIKAFDGTSLYSAADIPALDLLLITHDHYDHLDYHSILALKPLVKQVVTGLGVGSHFELWGYDPSLIQELDWYGELEISADLKIHATPARHYSGRTFTRNQSIWLGFVIESQQRRLFFSGDSGYGSHFSEIRSKYGAFDWVTLDSGQYDPRWAHLHMTPEQAAQAADDLNTQAMTPAHVGRFTLAPHDWFEPFERLSKASHHYDYQLWTPVIGQAIYFDGREQVFKPWWKAAL